MGIKTTLMHLSIATLFTPFLSNAAIINVHSPLLYNSDTNAMNAALGISNYEIESFNDEILLEGLSYSLIEPDVGPITELANLLSFSTSYTWDDGYFLSNAGAGENLWSAPWAQGITFMFDGGINSFGLGLANLETPYGGNHSVLVNDKLIGTLESDIDFVSSSFRNGYLTINGAVGEKINSVTILSERINKDGFILDHLAINRDAKISVPETTSLPLFLCAIFLLVCRQLKKKHLTPTIS